VHDPCVARPLVGLEVDQQQMNAITDLSADATTLFTGVTTLAVLVAGFFLGRKWIHQMGNDYGEAELEDRNNQAIYDEDGEIRDLKDQDRVRRELGQ